MELTPVTVPWLRERKMNLKTASLKEFQRTWLVVACEQEVLDLQVGCYRGSEGQMVTTGS